MSKKIELSEEKWEQPSVASTLFDIFTLGAAGAISSAIAETTGGGERTTYSVTIDGDKKEFKTKEERDEVAKKAI